MADPLSLLRDFTINQKPVSLDGDFIVFDDVRFPRNTETAFKSLKGVGPPYTIDACWFMVQNADKKYTDYLMDCSKFKFPKISLVDKKELVSYLQGKIDSSPYITLTHDLPLPNVASFGTPDLKRTARCALCFCAFVPPPKKKTTFALLLFSPCQDSLLLHALSLCDVTCSAISLIILLDYCFSPNIPTKTVRLKKEKKRIEMPRSPSWNHRILS